MRKPAEGDFIGHVRAEALMEMARIFQVRTMNITHASRSADYSFIKEVRVVPSLNRYICTGVCPFSLLVLLVSLLHAAASPSMCVDQRQRYACPSYLQCPWQAFVYQQKLALDLVNVDGKPSAVWLDTLLRCSVLQFE